MFKNLLTALTVLSVVSLNGCGKQMKSLSHLEIAKQSAGNARLLDPVNPDPTGPSDSYRLTADQLAVPGQGVCSNTGAKEAGAIAISANGLNVSFVKLEGQKPVSGNYMSSTYSTHYVVGDTVSSSMNPADAQRFLLNTGNFVTKGNLGDGTYMMFVSDAGKPVGPRPAIGSDLMSFILSSSQDGNISPLTDYLHTRYLVIIHKEGDRGTAYNFHVLPFFSVNITQTMGVTYIHDTNHGLRNYGSLTKGSSFNMKTLTGNVATSDIKPGDPTCVADGDSPTGYSNPDVVVCDDYELKLNCVPQACQVDPSPPTAPGEDPCVVNVSPLILDIETSDLKSAQVSFLPPLDGVWFNIDGGTDQELISWVENPKKDLFLALPDRAGKINGIDQLFGDRTIGPDGRAASDGFEALAKYDSNGDEKIDSRDPIFEKLVLWEDSGANRGTADSGEYIKLSDHLSEIDLDAERISPYQRDVFGNETRLRSVAKHRDGSYRVIFDVWFRVISHR